MYTKLIGILILGLVSFSTCENWALLVAGSNGWYNYRHQADVCHSYQMLHKKGFPDDHIVVMMYDDIASDSSNPTPGQIINYPNGPDVYKGVPKDYTKKDVNPMNFLNILSGNAEAMKGIGSGKVIASGPNDKIFVFFSDHGATNLIAFPNDYLYADDLIKTLTAMYNNKQYKELVFYLEACESGSMFNGLLQSNMNIYTTTAANPCQSSYACYYDENRQTYLGDCYSVNWMIDTEHHNENKETFEQQYLTIKKETNMSQVCQYGQLSMSSETLSNFLENSQTTKSRSTLVTRPFIGEHSAVDQRDVELSILTHRLRVEKEHNIDIIQSEIREILESRRKYDNLFHTMALKLIGNEYPDILVLTEKNGKFEDGECKKCEEYIPTINMDCLKDAIRGIESSCGKFTHYGLGYTKWISRMCNLGIEADEIYNIATEYCI